MDHEKTKKDKFNFKYENVNLDIVDNFKYLGITLKFNGNFDLCKKENRDKGIRSMFALLSKGRSLGLPIDIKLELFDKIVMPVLLYGCEIWGFIDVKNIESVHIKFCKYLLNVKSSTRNCMVYSELGRFPLSIHSITRIYNFWGKYCYWQPE